MDLSRLPSSVLLLLAYGQLGELELRKVLADALAASAGQPESTTRVRQVASSLIDVASGKDEGLTRLITVLSVPTDQDALLIEQLRKALSRSLEVGDHERADALRDALRDASDGRLFWQSSVKGLLTGRLAPSVIPLPVTCVTP